MASAQLCYVVVTVLVRCSEVEVEEPFDHGGRILYRGTSMVARPNWATTGDIPYHSSDYSQYS